MVDKRPRRLVAAARSSMDDSALASKAAAGEIIVSEQALKQAGIDGSDLEARSLEIKGISAPVLVRVMRCS